MADVPLLTDTHAALLRGHSAEHIAGCMAALDAIATNRAKTVAARTEDEWRMLFWSLVPTNGASKPSDMIVIIARHLGLVADDKGGG